MGRQKLKIECSCLTADGHIYVGFMKNENGDISESIAADTYTAKVEGKILKFTSDKTSMLVIHQKDDDVHLSMLH